MNIPAFILASTIHTIDDDEISVLSCVENDHLPVEETSLSRAVSAPVEQQRQGDDADQIMVSNPTATGGKMRPRRRSFQTSLLKQSNDLKAVRSSSFGRRLSSVSASTGGNTTPDRLSNSSRGLSNLPRSSAFKCHAGSSPSLLDLRKNSLASRGSFIRDNHHTNHPQCNNLFKLSSAKQSDGHHEENDSSIAIAAAMMISGAGVSSSQSCGNNAGDSSSRRRRRSCRSTMTSATCRSSPPRPPKRHNSHDSLGSSHAGRSQ